MDEAERQFGGPHNVHTVSAATSAMPSRATSVSMQGLTSGPPRRDVAAVLAASMRVGSSEFQLGNTVGAFVGQAEDIGSGQSAGASGMTALDSADWGSAWIGESVLPASTSHRLVPPSVSTQGSTSGPPRVMSVVGQSAASTTLSSLSLWCNGHEQHVSALAWFMRGATIPPVMTGSVREYQQTTVFHLDGQSLQQSVHRVGDGTDGTDDVSTAMCMVKDQCQQVEQLSVQVPAASCYATVRQYLDIMGYVRLCLSPVVWMCIVRLCPMVTTSDSLTEFVGHMAGCSGVPQ